MSKVQLKFPPWMTGLVNVQTSGWFIIEKDVTEGTTVSNFLADIAFSHADFKKAVFDPSLRKFSDNIILVINDKPFHLPDTAETKLYDGDSIILLPVFSGG